MLQWPLAYRPPRGMLSDARSGNDPRNRRSDSGHDSRNRRSDSGNDYGDQCSDSVNDFGNQCSYPGNDFGNQCSDSGNALHFFSNSLLVMEFPLFSDTHSH